MDDEKLFDAGFNDLPVNESTSDDAIELDPSDFETEEVTEPTSEDTETVEETKELTPQQRMLKVKVDREERELSEEEAIPYIQKGMVADRLIARAAQEARDAYIREQGYTWNDKPITTEAEYKQAVEEKRIYDEAMKMAEREGIPEEFAKRMLSLEQREQQREKEIQAEKQAKQEEEKYQKDYNEFFQYFESANDRRFDPKTDILPQEVIDAANNGVPLKYAYMDYHAKQLRNSLKVSKQNETNSKRAPVASVTAHGNNAKEAEDDFLKGWNS